MIGQERCQQILKRVLDMVEKSPHPPFRKGGISFSESEPGETWDADAYLTVQEQALTRFASNISHQNVSHSNAQLHLRAVVGKRQGRATTNDLSDRGMQRVAEQARQNALLMPEDPHFQGLPSPDQPPRVRTYDGDTASYSPEARAHIVGAVCGKARAQGLDASGLCRTGTQETAVMSTRGAQAYHAGTFAGVLIMAMSDTSSGWAKGGSWRISDIDAETLADEAIGKARRGRDPRPVEPGQYTVVLDPYAVDDILSALSLYGMGAQLVQEGRSWMNGLMGQQAMSPLVCIWDDGADPTGWPVPFDAEGVPRQRTDIVNEGVVGGPVHNSYTAGKEGKGSTGHQASFTGGPMATNLFMKEGGCSLAEMIAATERGLYITRFHYTRLVHSRGCVMTGMTRDGTFLIEKGQLSHPVKNLRFTQSYVEALAGVEAVGSQSRLLLNEGGFATRVPALKLASFNFTGVTV